jgi:pimeloyl-ACP methyl ester carboxylesterase
LGTGLEIMSGNTLNTKADPIGTGQNPATRRHFSRRWKLALLGITLLCAAGVAGAVKYYRFYYHLTPQEVSHTVEHETFDATIRSDKTIKLQIYQQANASSQQLVLFTSGDGGWSPFCADIAAHLASGGRTVVGFDSKDYLTSFSTSESPVTPEEISKDYQDILTASLKLNGVNQSAPVILSGWSLGAGYSLLAASTPAIKASVNRVVAISLPLKNELAWKASDALIYITHGTPHEKVFDSREYIARLGDTPVAIMNASDDDNAPIKDAQTLFNASPGPKKLFVVKASGHHFEGGEQEFYMHLDEAFDPGLVFESLH